ncbi:hypothetical protein CHS0354_042545 [Potamilus streckersoni]|uniref:Uncharacterized protein n=1 Tax=Potamilus streckersoni TaxID=2493646 RepID=A0AAE0TE45_9BIVA|nr:hypothetical protein CHS0354_042545 [Potamilus streckersoni]
MVLELKIIDLDIKLMSLLRILYANNGNEWGDMFRGQGPVFMYKFNAAISDLQSLRWGNGICAIRYVLLLADSKSDEDFTGPVYWKRGCQKVVCGISYEYDGEVG